MALRTVLLFVALAQLEPRAALAQSSAPEPGAEEQPAEAPGADAAAGGEGAAGAEPGTPDATDEGSEAPERPREPSEERVAPSRSELPTVAVVLRGDPAEELQARARALSSRISEDDAARAPRDAALRAAFLGEPPATDEDDGLGPVRALRRRLGISEEMDREVLGTLGELSHADAVVVVFSRGGAARAEVFDAHRMHLFEGSIALTEEGEAASRLFVLHRARAAHRHRGETLAEEERASQAAGVDPSAAPHASRSAAELEQPDTRQEEAIAEAAAEGEDEGEPSFIKKNWPYFAAGALFVGALTAILLTRSDGVSDERFFRFQPGEM